MGVYKRGSMLWLRYAGPDGQVIRESTGQSDEQVALCLIVARRRQLVAGSWTPGTLRPEGLLLWDYAEVWIDRQFRRGLKTAKLLEQRTRSHLLPRLGERTLAGLRPRTVIDFVSELKSGPLAPRTVHHVYNCLRSICRDAVIDEILPATPCVLPPGTLPKRRDRDPAWRATAIYTRDEVRLLARDARVPWIRRVLYAMFVFTGMRVGEVVGRRWKDLELEVQPLGRLTVASQYRGEPLKTDVPRSVPVHPSLHAILEDWRRAGWPHHFGRAPNGDDWTVPQRNGNMWTSSRCTWHQKRDLRRLGLRHRRLHDLRRTFITLARADGADKEVLRRVTHGVSTDIVDLYTSYPWKTICDAVATLRL